MSSVHRRLRRTLPAWTPRHAVLLALSVLLGGAAACGDDGGDGSEACGPIRREALDPDSLVHVLGDTPGLSYGSDPPTSGPHQPGPAIDAVLDEALSRPVQVGILERGDVLVQFRPDDLDPAATGELEALAGDGVVVAPNPDLPEPVVATAWVYSRRCDAVDAGALQEFVDERQDKGPES